MPNAHAPLLPTTIWCTCYSSLSFISFMVLKFTHYPILTTLNMHPMPNLDCIWVLKCPRQLSNCSASALLPQVTIWSGSASTCKAHNFNENTLTTPHTVPSKPLSHATKWVYFSSGVPWASKRDCDHGCGCPWVGPIRAFMHPHDTTL